jgi:Secretion system C-terminal sorting domain
MRQLFFFLMLCASLANGQEAITASYGSGTIGGQVIDWTLGDMAAIETIENTNLIVTQGFLQPVSGKVLTEEPRLDKGIVELFPNPTQDWVNLKATFADPVVLRYSVMDISGKLLLEKNLDGVQQVHSDAIDLSGFAAGTYLFRVEAAGKGWDFFKVVKVAD